MFRITGILLMAVVLSACGSTAKKTSVAATNQPTAATENKVAETASQPKQVCRLERQMGSNHKTRVCRSK